MKGNAFLEWVITCNETQIHQFEPESKYLSLPARKYTKPTNQLVKVFWEYKSFAIVHKYKNNCYYFKEKHTIISD